MGCGSSNKVYQPSQKTFSLTGKAVKEEFHLRGRTLLNDRGPTQVFYVRDIVLINALNKEISQRIKESANVPKNNENEFLDLRSNEAFTLSHLIFFLTYDTNSEISEQMLKVLFDFKHIFILTDDLDTTQHIAAIQAADQTRGSISASSLLAIDQNIKNSSNSGTNNSNNNMNAGVSLPIPNKVRSLIRLFALKGIKPKSFLILESNYSQLVTTFPDYVIDKARLSQPESQFPALIGENQILRRTIFPQLQQLPLHLYDHSIFRWSNSNNIKAQQQISSTQLQIGQLHVQSLQSFNANISGSGANIALGYYVKSLRIKSLVVVSSKMLAENEVPVLDSLRGSCFKSDEQGKIAAMKQLHGYLEANQSVLILRDNTKEGLLDVLQIVKGLLFEKYCVFSNEISEYLSCVLPKNIVFTSGGSGSRVVPIGQSENGGVGDGMNQSLVLRSSEKRLSKKEEENNMTRCERLKVLVLPIVNANKKNRGKFDAYMDVFMKLFENLVRNPEEEKYRSFKKDNKIMKDTILRYKETSAILHLCGFLEQGSVYTNQLEIKDITPIKGDLDLAFKNAIKEVFNQ